MKTDHFITPQKWMIEAIQKDVKDYLTKYNIKALVIGISGGFDSGFNAAILKSVCDELGIPLLGRYIHISTNKPEEKHRAALIGDSFCTEYQDIDLSGYSNSIIAKCDQNNYHLKSGELNADETDFQKKVRWGNIKARMRMIYLYNLAQMYGGIVVDNDNKTEHMLGFWTLNGDVGDITPLADFFKTEAYALAELYASTLTDEKQKKALEEVIAAVPTDGLGITSSDVEQFGVSSYYEVDKILSEIENGAYKVTDECPFTSEEGIKIWNRWKNSNFKRHHPYKVHVIND